MSRLVVLIESQGNPVTAMDVTSAAASMSSAASTNPILGVQDIILGIEVDGASKSRQRS